MGPFGRVEGRKIRLGNVHQANGHVHVSAMAYDADGNLIREVRADGKALHHHYDGHRIATVDDRGVYTGYTYNVAGERTDAHRHAQPVDNPASATPPEASAADQKLTFVYDRLGRVVQELQHGADEAQTRVTAFGYDAEGNQVRILDSRGFESRLFYDGLGRATVTVNPSGGLITHTFDADGNVIARNTGGLYLIMDIYSRKIVGFEVFDTEWAANSRDVIERAVLRAGVAHRPVVLHADNGSAMTGSTLRVTLEALGITPSHSRPRVSNDNAYSEALFRPCKYRPDYPPAGFAELRAARQWVLGFVHWYKQEHRHGAIRFVTPAQRHAGWDREILARRERIQKAARRQHPERWSGKTRNWKPIGAVWLNPEPALEVA